MDKMEPSSSKSAMELFKKPLEVPRKKRKVLSEEKYAEVMALVYG